MKNCKGCNELFTLSEEILPHGKYDDYCTICNEIIEYNEAMVQLKNIKP
jgi:hypothetical protein